MKKKKPPLSPEALEFFKQTGAEGGRAKVPKGFAVMDEAAKKRAIAKSLATKRAKAALKKKAK